MAASASDARVCESGEPGMGRCSAQSKVMRATATDGRGAGLRAIDVEVKDKGALFLAAERHGLEFSDSKVTVCGTDINLV